jgi:hypothetical protein
MCCRWGLFEGSLTATTTDASANPFTDVELTVVFTSGVEKVTVTGFYDGARSTRCCGATITCTLAALRCCATLLLRPA